mgnify:CR=1 FL=1
MRCMDMVVVRLQRELTRNFDNKKNPSKGLIMWKMMGGNSGQSWSRRLKKSLDVIQKKEKLNKIINTVEAIQLGILR